MEEAERMFYSGRYQEAIRLFDRVLQAEPKWERARQHRSELENYLRTGYIPPVALPAEAASAFGKAQSASRVGRYSDALALLGKAQAALRELGIQRWQEGLEFEQKLQESIDAEHVYQEGLRLFEQGKLDEAIESIETAARATGLPKYGDKAQELRGVRDRLAKSRKPCLLYRSIRCWRHRPKPTWSCSPPPMKRTRWCSVCATAWTPISRVCLDR